MITYITLFVAGVLITFSPCILPALPLIGAASIQRHRLGPVMMAFGLMIGFILMGVGLKTLALVFHFSVDLWRQIAALLLITLGILAIVSKYSLWTQQLFMPLVGFAQRRSQNLESYGLMGQCVIGMLLGIIWSPCVGPALGGVMLLILNGTNYIQATSMLFAFSFGTAFSLTLIAYLFRQGIPVNLHLNWIPIIFGGFLIVAGLLVISGLDLTLQSYFLQQLPKWWLSIITRY